MAKTSKQPTFEQKLDELERIIASLEQGDMPLDRAIETYKRGVELARELRVQLEGARQQLRVLSAQYAPGDSSDEQARDAD